MGIIIFTHTHIHTKWRIINEQKRSAQKEKEKAEPTAAGLYGFIFRGEWKKIQKRTKASIKKEDMYVNDPKPTHLTALPVSMIAQSQNLQFYISKSKSFHFLFCVCRVWLLFIFRWYTSLNNDTCQVYVSIFDHQRRGVQWRQYTCPSRSLFSRQHSRFSAIRPALHIHLLRPL